MAKYKDLLFKLPKAFFLGLFGLVLGGVGGAIFASLGFIPELAWQNIFIFFGSFVGFILGFLDDGEL